MVDVNAHGSMLSADVAIHLQVISKSRKNSFKCHAFRSFLMQEFLFRQTKSEEEFGT